MVQSFPLNSHFFVSVSVMEPSPHIRAIFFDVVGTVLFPSPGAPQVYAEMARRGGLDLHVHEIRSRFIEAYSAEEAIDQTMGWRTSEEREQNRWKNIVATTLRGVHDPESCFTELYEHFARPASWRLGDDVGRVIEALIDRGTVVGLGSNYDSRLWSVLEGFPELMPLRKRTIISSIVGFRKPSVEFFRNVVSLAGCEASAVLFVGDDMENDYLGASRAGLESVLFDENPRPDAPRRIARLSDLIER
jgi:putative hydrolase of the HAD superfamily